MRVLRLSLMTFHLRTSVVWFADVCRSSRGGIIFQMQTLTWSALMEESLAVDGDDGEAGEAAKIHAYSYVGRVSKHPMASDSAPSPRSS